jgi:hypothetical protein
MQAANRWFSAIIPAPSITAFGRYAFGDRGCTMVYR